MIRRRLNHLCSTNAEDARLSSQTAHSSAGSIALSLDAQSSPQRGTHGQIRTHPGNFHLSLTSPEALHRHGSRNLHQYIAHRSHDFDHLRYFQRAESGLVTPDYTAPDGPQVLATPRDRSAVLRPTSTGFPSEATLFGQTSAFSSHSFTSQTSAQATSGQWSNDGQQTSRQPPNRALRDLIRRRIQDQNTKGCHPPARAGMQSGLFECTLGCGQRFKSSADLIRHENTVWPQEFYFCNLCGDPANPSMKVLFTREDKLKAHLRKFHRADLDTKSHRVHGVKAPFLTHCDKCDIHFNDWESRRDHIKSHCRNDRPRRSSGRRPSTQMADSGEDDDEDEDDQDGQGEEEDDNTQGNEDEEDDGGTPPEDHTNNDGDHDGNDANGAPGANGGTSQDPSNGNGTDGSEPADGRSGTGGASQDFADLCHWDSPTSWNRGLHHPSDPHHEDMLIWREKINTKGGMSSIFRVELAGHLCTGSISRASLFAVKQYSFHHRESFRREAEAFRVLQMLGVRTQSLLLCLGIFLDVSPWGQPTFNLLLELGEGDLTTYWATARPSRSGVMTSWLLRQLHGLTEALLHIHTCGRPSNQDDGVGLRHGDIKPENILWFPEADKRRGTFKIADFGLSTIHTSRTESLNAIGGTLRYSGYTRSG